MVKSVIFKYIHNGSAVRFLDASKVFDMVDHSILFQNRFTVASSIYSSSYLGIVHNGCK